MEGKTVTFSHVVLKGSAYEVGKQQGEAIKAFPEFAAYCRSGKGAFSAEAFGKVTAAFNRYCPGINEELQGFADALGAPVEEIVYYAATWLRAGHCSHVAALPAITADHHVLVGRSYEFGDTMDDMMLYTTAIEGKYAHIGFSSLLFGRNEGMNDQGLSVTMSTGGIPVGNAPGLRPAVQDGVHFWALVRTLLEQCATVDEALELIATIPACGNPNLIITDRGEHAALVELYGPHSAVKRIDSTSVESYVCSTNHFTLPGMEEYTGPVMPNSPVRYQTIQRYIEQTAPKVSVETLKTLLTTGYPNGLCCHYYEEFFGTLHSMIFDLTAGQIEIGFGSPAANGWHTIDFRTEAAQYQIQLPQEHADASFWK